MVTFWPLPRLVLTHTHAAPIQLLTGLEEKITLLEQQGVDHLVILPFTPTFSQLSASDFIQEVFVQQLGTQHIIIGHDHRFGKGRSGNVALLQESGQRHGFTVTEVAPIMVDDKIISSTKIRKLLLAGNVEQAQAYLGRPYTMPCIVQKDDVKSEKGLSVVPVSTHQLIPGAGSYEVQFTYQDSTHAGELCVTDNMRPLQNCLKIQAIIFL